MTNTAIREKPIIFSGPMVRAILDGRKTQTRRIIPRLIGSTIDRPRLESCRPMRRVRYEFMGNLDADPSVEISLKPFAFPGDHLWVRESFAKGVVSHIFKADFNVADGFGSEVVHLPTGESVPLIWKPSIHMPRSLSRITLEVTEVRVERLQAISAKDAEAEGVEWNKSGMRCGHTNPISAFKSLWDSINSKRVRKVIKGGVVQQHDKAHENPYSWASNPYEWCITFKRVKP